MVSIDTSDVDLASVSTNNSRGLPKLLLLLSSTKILHSYRQGPQGTTRQKFDKTIFELILQNLLFQKKITNTLNYTLNSDKLYF